MVKICLKGMIGAEDKVGLSEGDGRNLGDGFRVFHRDPFLVPLGATVEPLRSYIYIYIYPIIRIMHFYDPPKTFIFFNLIKIGVLWVQKNL